jgi:hypothetical protein
LGAKVSKASKPISKAPKETYRKQQASNKKEQLSVRKLRLSSNASFKGPGLQTFNSYKEDSLPFIQALELLP